jgi:hypothetical protein
MAIAGLDYIAGFIDRSTQTHLLDKIDLEPWLDDLQRRVQHYGYKYDYKARKIDRAMYLGALPTWAQPVAEQLLSEG